jgi:hypothetical protein
MLSNTRCDRSGVIGSGAASADGAARTGGSGSALDGRTNQAYATAALANVINALPDRRSQRLALAGG